MSAEDHMDVGGDLADREAAKEQQDLDFLDEPPMSEASTAVSQDLAEMAEILAKLGYEYECAKERMQQAKDLFDQYRTVTLPNAFKLAGFRYLETANGTVVRVTRDYHCTPNKNEADQRTLMAWLKERKGEHLIKKEAKVAEAMIEKLDEYNIPHTTKEEVNTMSLKAWIIGELGEKGGVATMDVKDIPPCVHFIATDTAEIVVPK